MSHFRLILEMSQKIWVILYDSKVMIWRWAIKTKHLILFEVWSNCAIAVVSITIEVMATFCWLHSVGDNVVLKAWILVTLSPQHRCGRSDMSLKKNNNSMSYRGGLGETALLIMERTKWSCTQKNWCGLDDHVLKKWWGLGDHELFHWKY